MPRKFISALLYASLLASSASALDCSRPPGSLPDETRPVGSVDPRIPVDHVTISMQENHSFDNYFGHLNKSGFYGQEVDGLDSKMANPGKKGETVPVFHQASLERPGEFGAREDPFGWQWPL